MNLQGKINLIKESKDNIKSAIIAKGVTPSGNISTYASAISQIDTTNNQSKTVTQNGVVRYDTGYTGLESVTVNVNQSVEDKVITENGTYNAGEGYIGLGEVTVQVPFITEEITVNPSTEAQDIETTVDGITEVHVLPVTASIDRDITANNIRQGVEILGVVGNIVELQGQTKSVSVVNSGTTTIRPDAPNNAFTSVSITPNLQSKTATTNGVVTPDSGYCGLSNVEVDVNLNLQDKTFTSNGTYSADDGYNGFENVTVDVNLSLQSKNITQNGTYTPDTGYNGFDSVAVNVQPNLQNKTITTNGTYTADSGYDGLGTITVQTQSVNNTNLTVTENGTYTPSGNYTGYGSVTVNVPQSTITGSGIPRVVENGVYGFPSTSFNFSLPEDATKIGTHALYCAFSNCTTLIEVDLSSLSIVPTGSSACFGSAFQNCRNLLNVDLSGLVLLGASQAFNGTFVNCSNLTNINIQNLTTIKNANGAFVSTFSFCSNLMEIDFSNLVLIEDSGSAFQNAFSSCTKLTSINFEKLQTISNSYDAMSYAFSGCTQLTNVTFDSLRSINASSIFQSAFQNCTSLTTLSFPKLTSNSFGSYTNQFNRMLSGVTGCTVHFPSNLQSVIGSWSDVTNGFGGTNTTVLFDLPATS